MAKYECIYSRHCNRSADTFRLSTKLHHDMKCAVKLKLTKNTTLIMQN